MRTNSETKISGFKTVLVPYRKSHVEKYHDWMQSEELLEETASKRLTLAEEYEMQQTWLRDDEKCTFIILDKMMMDVLNNEVASMIGDVNLYLSKNNLLQNKGEISLMIAEESFRKAGRGMEAAMHMLRYGIEKLLIIEYTALISEDNYKSISLFSKLRFEIVGRNAAFEEVVMKRNVDKQWTAWLIENTPHYELGLTEPNN